MWVKTWILISFILLGMLLIKSLMSILDHHDNSFDWMGGDPTTTVKDNLVFFKPISVDILSWLGNFIDIQKFKIRCNPPYCVQNCLEVKTILSLSFSSVLPLELGPQTQTRPPQGSPQHLLHITLSSNWNCQGQVLVLVHLTTVSMYGNHFVNRQFQLHLMTMCGHLQPVLSTHTWCQPRIQGCQISAQEATP